MRPKLAPAPSADAKVAAIAARQYGVATLAQLLAAGLTPAGVHRRVAARRLHRVHQGVYAVGHRSIPDRGRWLAATLACGSSAALSHRSAAELWGLLAPLGGRVHVTIPGRAGRARRAGIRIHRPRSFDASLTAVHHGIIVTTVARTITDLRRSVPRPVLRRAIREAEFRGMPTGGANPDRTRSELERAFLEICRRHAVPEPEVNVRVGRFTVDFLWRRQGLVVEVDGYAYHRGRQAFRDDRDRDLELAALGLTVHRFADSRIAEDPQGVGATTRELLGRAGARGPSGARKDR
jgi:very-short-patch-repair endonuclease